MIFSGLGRRHGLLYRPAHGAGRLSGVTIMEGGCRNRQKTGFYPVFCAWTGRESIRVSNFWHRHVALTL